MRAIVAATLVLGCGRIGYYPIPSATHGDFEVVGDAAVNLDAGVIVPDVDATRLTDAAVHDAGLDGSAGCAGSGPLVEGWGFSTGAEGWSFSHPGPKPTWEEGGSISVAGDGDAGLGEIHGWLSRRLQPAMDLTGTEITFRVSLKAGENLVVETYASSGVFAGYEFKTLESTGWVCVKIDPSNKNGFDSTKVSEIGLGLNSIGPATFYVDDVQIRLAAH